MIKKILPIIILLLIIVPAVLSIGVSPIRKVVDYEPNKEVDLSIKVTNDGQQDIKALVYARGELQERIGIVDSLLSITKGSDAVARYKLNMPPKFDTPGVHKTDIVVMEYPKSFGTEEGSMVTATASVVSELWLRVPYPGKYIEGQLFVNSKESQTDFVINVMNFGKANVAKAKATIKILGATYEEIARLETNEISLESKGQGKLVGKWDHDVNPGTYRAVVEIAYDQKKLVIEENFDIGSLYVEIKEIEVRDFTLGQIAVLDILLESKWNQPIKDVYGELSVLDNTGTEFSRIKTAAIDLSSNGQGTINAYWDTKDIKVGTYDLQLLIHYGEKVTEQIIETEVGIDSINTNLGLTAQVVAAPGIAKENILTILVIILVLVNVAWFVFFVKKKKWKETKKLGWGEFY